MTNNIWDNCPDNGLFSREEIESIRNRMETFHGPLLVPQLSSLDRLNDAGPTADEFLFGWITKPQGSAIVTFLKERAPGPIYLNLEAGEPLKFTDLDWKSEDYPQALSRIKRVSSVNAVLRSGPLTSRNAREGHYAFKIKGKHTRKRRPGKVVVMQYDPNAEWALALAKMVEKK